MWHHRDSGSNVYLHQYSGAIVLFGLAYFAFLLTRPTKGPGSSTCPTRVKKLPIVDGFPWIDSPTLSPSDIMSVEGEKMVVNRYSLNRLHHPGLYSATILLEYAPKYFAVRPRFFILFRSTRAPRKEISSDYNCCNGYFIVPQPECHREYTRADTPPCLRHYYKKRLLNEKYLKCALQFTRTPCKKILKKVSVEPC